MSASAELLQVLKAHAIQLYTSFPDKWLGPFLRELEADPTLLHIPSTIEREALGIAVGAQLAGLRSALVMPNSGIGNLLNDWASLAYNYGITVPWIVSDRGSTGEQMTTQMIWHSRLRDVLAAAGIPAANCTSTLQLPDIAELLEYGYTTRQCVAALFPHAFWREDLAMPQINPGSALRAPLPVSELVAWAKSGPPQQATWRRYDALTCLLDMLDDAWLFVTLGDPCKEVYSIRDREETFYMLGSMGVVLPLGLGFARAYAALGGQRKTVVVDGDGSQLMQLGSLGTLAREQPDVALIIIDNGSYGSTGDQPTLTRTQVNLAGVAQALGLQNTLMVGTPHAFEARLKTVLTSPGPSVTVVTVCPGAPVTPLLPLPAIAIAQRFREACGAEAASLPPAFAAGLSSS